MVAASAPNYLSTLLFFLFICSRTHLTNTSRLPTVSGPLLDLGMGQWGVRQQSLPLWNFILLRVGHWCGGHRQHGALRTRAGKNELSSRTTCTYLTSPGPNLSLSPGSFCSAHSPPATPLPCFSSCESFPLLLMQWDLCCRQPCVCVPAPGFPHWAHCQNHREPCKSNPVRLQELTSNKL